MRYRTTICAAILLSACILVPYLSHAADHNDPNAVNSIFSDITPSAADLYDLFGYPSDDKTGGEKVVIALTFAAVPKAGILDTDLLYMINVNPTPRVSSLKEDHSLEALLKYADAVKDKYLQRKASIIRVTFTKDNQANVEFIDFPGGSFTKTIETNKTLTLQAPDGASIKAFVGGRDDPFFNDLPGFFRSINYAPQFYHIPNAKADMRELPIPKTLLELEGNTLFNFDPKNPRLGQGVKVDFPAGAPVTWSGNKFHKDENGNFRFVYSGRDAQAGKNVNALIFEIPLTYITTSPSENRIVNAWGESWVLKASHKVETIPDHPPTPWLRLLVVLIVAGVAAWLINTYVGTARVRAVLNVLVVVGLALLVLQTTGFLSRLATRTASSGINMNDYKRVDTDGVPFEDAALSEREDERQLGANNVKLASHFVQRFGHLGWGFGPSVTALGIGTCFDHDNSPVSVYKTYALAAEAFPRVKRCLFQDMNMPDNSWNKSGVNIPLKKPFEIFVPNVCAIDMDTNGTWPYGRRLEDQVATRFLSVFLDMETGCGGKKCNVDTLGDQALWDKLPIEPKTPPNPLKNDKEFLTQFPYLADPWPDGYVPAYQK